MVIFVKSSFTDHVPFLFGLRPVGEDAAVEEGHVASSICASGSEEAAFVDASNVSWLTSENGLPSGFDS